MEQKRLAEEMLAFVSAIPKSVELEWAKDYEFLFHFEAERLLTMRNLLLADGISETAPLRVLDFGYLHGLVPEFLHRFFPQAKFTILDHPASPNFRNAEYLNLIQTRTYLQMEACDIAEVGAQAGVYDLVILGELIEHLDPTTVAKAFRDLRHLIAPGGRLMITTPNGAGIKNLVFTAMSRDAQHPPFSDETMNYGHIHLWTPSLLNHTLQRLGWARRSECFVHGPERWDVQKANRHWGSLRHQILLRTLYVLAELKPAWRGFFVSLWQKPALAS